MKELGVVLAYYLLGQTFAVVGTQLTAANSDDRIVIAPA